jgi:hypothetical protein
VRLRAIRRQYLVPGISRSTTNLRPVSPLGVSIEQSSVSRLFPGQRLDVFAQTNPRSSAWSELALVGELISYFVSFFSGDWPWLFRVFEQTCAESNTTGRFGKCRPPNDSRVLSFRTLCVGQVPSVDRRMSYALRSRWVRSTVPNRKDATRVVRLLCPLPSANYRRWECA